jgi:hypothetical protein
MSLCTKFLAVKNKFLLAHLVKEGTLFLSRLRKLSSKHYRSYTLLKVSINDD